MTNLASNLADTTRTLAGRVAVRVDNAAMTYRVLDEASARVAGLLHERGLKPGDRVGIMLPNVAEVPVAAKRVLRASQGLDDPAAFARQDDLIAGLTSSQDAREGAMAFVEKRKPVWQGR